MPTNEIQLQHLPLFARVAIERLECDESLRDNRNLDELLNAYAKIYGLTCDSLVRDCAHSICNKKFGTSFSFL